MALCRQVAGDKHRDTSVALTNLGAVLQTLGNYAEARPCYEQALAITRDVAGKLRSATAHRIDFTGCPVVTRLSRVLLELAVRYGDQARAGTVIRCPLTQTELATLVGAAEPTVQRVLRQLRVDNVVSTGYRETTVLDMAGLKRRADAGRH